MREQKAKVFLTDAFLRMPSVTMDWPVFHQAVAEWQRANGATCAHCEQRNEIHQCDACGWWGKCPPDGVTPSTPGPMTADFRRTTTGTA